MTLLLPVLRQQGVLPDDGLAPGTAIAVHVQMEKFWEHCLEMALQSAFASVSVSRDAAPGEGVSVPAPWGVPMAAEDGAGLPSEAFPDFLFQSRHHVVLADAKYKLHIGSAPSSQDGYQLFAYSHLATLNGRASDFGVILYPARVGAEPAQTELTRMRDRSYPLWLATVSFPTRDDVQSQATWSAYVARLASVLRGFGGEWVLRRSAEPAM